MQPFLPAQVACSVTITLSPFQGPPLRIRRSPAHTYHALFFHTLAASILHRSPSLIISRFASEHPSNVGDPQSSALGPVTWSPSSPHSYHHTLSLLQACFFFLFSFNFNHTENKENYNDTNVLITQHYGILTLVELKLLAHPSTPLCLLTPKMFLLSRMWSLSLSCMFLEHLFKCAHPNQYAVSSCFQTVHKR